MKILSKFLILLAMLLASASGRAATFDQNSAILTNPYMPWNVGAEFVLAGAGDATGISLRHRCLNVESIGGVNCLKVETLDIGRANLLTYWWIAQDTEGNIWQLQQSDEQFDGSFETDSGEWLYMPANFSLGESLELYGAYADAYTVVSITGTAPTPYRTFTSCIVTEINEFGYIEQQFISPGFGPVSATFSGFENGSFDLQSVSGFNPPAQQAPVFTAHPNNQTIEDGEAAVFSASASGNPSPTYQWQRKLATSETWSDLTNGGNYSGVTSATLTVSGTTSAMSGDQYRCIANNAAGTAISNPASITFVNQNPVAQFTVQELDEYGVSGIKSSDGTFLIGKKILIDASASNDPDGEIVNHWFVLSGKYSEINLTWQPAHDDSGALRYFAYIPRQDYQLTLHVVDNEGLGSVETKSITVDLANSLWSGENTSTGGVLSLGLPPSGGSVDIFWLYYLVDGEYNFFYTTMAGILFPTSDEWTYFIFEDHQIGSLRPEDVPEGAETIGSIKYDIQIQQVLDSSGFGDIIASIYTGVRDAPASPIEIQPFNIDATGKVTLELKRHFSVRVQIEVSDDLINWAPFEMVEFGKESISIEDEAARGAKQRYYRFTSMPEDL